MSTGFVTLRGARRSALGGLCELSHGARIRNTVSGRVRLAGVCLGLALTVLAGCGEPHQVKRAVSLPAISFTVARPAAPGQTLHLIIENRTGAELGFGPGCEVLEPHTYRGWRPITHTHGALLFCSDVLLRAGGPSVMDTYVLPTDLAPGAYRLTFHCAVIPPFSDSNDESARAYLAVLPPSTNQARSAQR